MVSDSLSLRNQLYQTGAASFGFLYQSASDPRHRAIAYEYGMAMTV